MLLSLYPYVGLVPKLSLHREIDLAMVNLREKNSESVLKKQLLWIIQLFRR